MLDSGAERPGFKSQPRRRRLTVLGKLFTSIVPLLHQAAKLVAALLGVARVTAGLAESNGAAYRRVYDSRHLQAALLPRTGISSGTLRSAVEYGLALPFLLLVLQVRLYYDQANEVLLSTDLSVSHLQSACDLHQHSALSYDQL